MRKIFVMLLAVVLSAGAYAQDSVRETFEKGLAAFQNNDYKLAVKCMNMVMKPSADPHMRTQAQEVIAKCNEYLNKDEVKVSTTGLAFRPDGDYKELNVWASGKWEITSRPDWVSVVNVTNNYIKLWCSENSSGMQRNGNMSIRCGTETVTVSLFQDKVQEKAGRVLFRTTPNNAYVEIAGQWAGYSSSPVPLGRGEYTAKISKEGYKTQEMTIVVENLTDEAKVVDVEMEPLFGKLNPKVVSESGADIRNVDFKIGMHHVDLEDLTNSHSFDDKGQVAFYGLYKDGSIPLNTGVYDLTVSADGYATEYRTVKISAGETTDLEVTMSSVMGKLLVRDRGRAEGAEVIIRDLGISAHVGDTLDVPVGRYQVEVFKDDHLLDDGTLDVLVTKGDLTVADAEMTRMVDLVVSTHAKGETLYIDGQKVNVRKDVHRIPLTEGETYLVEVKKEGYWNFSEEIKVTSRDTLFDFTGVTLEEVHPLKLKIDEGGMKVEMKRIGDESGQDYAQGMVTDNTKGAEILNIPYGKYKVKLMDQSGQIKKRASRLVTYRGKINFNEKDDKEFIQTWSTASVATLKFLNVEYTLYPASRTASSSYMPIQLRANMWDMALVRGLSTSFLEGSMIYSANMDMPAGLPENHYTTLMPAVSLPFTNYDFRIGGGLFPFGEVCAFVSYSYDLELDRIATAIAKKIKKTYTGALDHFGGHEVFGGIELSSRIRYFNFYVRAGIQYLKGARYYVWGEYDETKGYSINRMDNMPVNQTSLIVTVGVNLGGRQSKGQNILMLF